jgi:hypothetical protein
MIWNIWNAHGDSQVFKRPHISQAGARWCKIKKRTPWKRQNDTGIKKCSVSGDIPPTFISNAELLFYFSFLIYVLYSTLTLFSVVMKVINQLGKRRKLRQLWVFLDKSRDSSLSLLSHRISKWRGRQKTKTCTCPKNVLKQVNTAFSATMCDCLFVRPCHRM